ncbi:ribonuclease H-like domain-containing protein [Tanacetum coccineum]
MWLFLHKYLVDGTLSRYKAHLVANGSTQLEGVDDDDETFSPVVKSGTILTVLSLEASRHWPVHQLDVKNAFLHGDLSKTVYMHQPLGFRDSVHPDYGTDIAYLLLYVDDIVLKASLKMLLQRIIRSLHQEFAMTDLGPLNYFLGISITRDSSGLFLSQKKYVVEILDRAHMVNCNPSRTPIDTESKLGSDDDPVFEPTLYRSLADSLQYLTFTRPDISYAIWLLIWMADWAGCPTTPHSTSGYCVFLGNNLLSWSSKRQPTLSRSSAEAGYLGVANVVVETCWLRNLLRKLYTPLSSATLVYCDNVSAVYLSCNPVQHQRTKHIEIDIHFVRDLVAVGQFGSYKCTPSSEPFKFIYRAHKSPNGNDLGRCRLGNMQFIVKSSQDSSTDTIWLGTFVLAGVPGSPQRNKHLETYVCGSDWGFALVGLSSRDFTMGQVAFVLAPEAMKLLNRVQRAMDSNVMTPRSTNVVFYRISFEIKKELAAQLVACLPFTIIALNAENQNNLVLLNSMTNVIDLYQEKSVEVEESYFDSRGIAPVAIIDRQLPFEYTIASRSTDVMVMAHPVQNINHSAFRSMFEREKLSGNIFNDWFRQLKLALIVEKKMYVIEHVGNSLLRDDITELP